MDRYEFSIPPPLSRLFLPPPDLKDNGDPATISAAAGGHRDDLDHGAWGGRQSTGSDKGNSLQFLQRQYRMDDMVPS